MAEGLRSIAEAAEWLGIPVGALQKLVAARRVPFCRPGGTKHIRFAPHHLEQIVAEGEVPVRRVPTRAEVVAIRADAKPKPAPSQPPPAPRPPAGPATPGPPAGPKTPSAERGAA